MRLLALTVALIGIIGLNDPLTASQPIYKVKDRDGNVVYTDEKPSPDAEPIELPDLGVMGEAGQTLEEALEAQTAMDPGIEPLSLTIVQPADGARLTDHGDGLVVELHSNVDLPPSTRIVLFLDDQPQEPIRQLVVGLAELDPGAYRLHAELQTPSGRVLTRTETVSFLLRAPPRPTPTP